MKKLVEVNQEINIVNHFNLVDKWIAFAQVKASSIKSYRKGIKNFATYCANNAVQNVSREMLINYRENLANKYSPSTANLYLTATKLFLNFLHLEGYINTNPAEHLKNLKVSSFHKKDALSVDMSKKIIANFDTSTLKGKRDKAMFSLMITTGLRTIEISATINLYKLIQEYLNLYCAEFHNISFLLHCVRFCDSYS